MKELAFSVWDIDDAQLFQCSISSIQLFGGFAFLDPPHLLQESTHLHNHFGFYCCPSLSTLEGTQKYHTDH